MVGLESNVSLAKAVNAMCNGRCQVMTAAGLNNP